MNGAANLIGLLIVGLVLVAVARQPTAIRAFFKGLKGTLGLIQ